MSDGAAILVNNRQKVKRKKKNSKCVVERYVNRFTLSREIFEDSDNTNTQIYNVWRIDNRVVRCVMFCLRVSYPNLQTAEL